MAKGQPHQKKQLMKNSSASLLIQRKLMKIIFSNILTLIELYIQKKQDLALDSPSRLIYYYSK